jgi:hypothetical protein
MRFEHTNFSQSHNDVMFSLDDFEGKFAFFCVYALCFAFRCIDRKRVFTNLEALDELTLHHKTQLDLSCGGDQGT